jgi:diguanylate cyclase (GGDEF)-like protein
MASFTGLIVASAHHERRNRERLTWLASHDPLTDLINRHAFSQRLQDALGSIDKHDRNHAVLCIDLDRFKRINDAEGHAAGDRVLREVAALLMDEVRRRDTVARLGGDEFALLLESCPLVEACGIAENIRRAVESYVYRGEMGDYDVEASIGVVEVDGRHDSGEVLHAADLACFEAKRAGRNRVWVGSLEAPAEQPA